MKRDEFYNYCYEVWQRGGNPDAVDPDDVPDGYDWVWDDPLSQHLPDQGTTGDVE